MYIKKYSTITITGRGLILLVDLLENNLVEDIYINKIPIKINDIVTTDKGHYKVNGIEMRRGSCGISSKIGLAVTKQTS